jgi:hypothetical protein
LRSNVGQTLSSVNLTLSALVIQLAGERFTRNTEAPIGYLGRSGTDDCNGVALDQAGDIYLACHSNSPLSPGR